MKIDNRRGRRRSPRFLCVAAACSTALISPGLIAQEHGVSARRPNFVMIVADDVSFTDLGAYGSEIRTPNIDALASQGVRFTNFHASPMCSPSRAMLLTGVDSHTAGVASLYEATPLRHRGKPGYEGHLRSDVVTIATRLQAAGYGTYMTGKWNLGHTASNLPSARGFDRTFALDATGADNFEKKPYLPLYTEVPWFADGEPTDLPDDFYSSEFLVNKMIEFLGTHPPAGAALDPTPFFAYVAFQAIHIPLQAPREFIERYEGVYDRGWEWLRGERRERSVKAGVIPAGAPAATSPAQRDWSSLPADERALFAKSMAVQAGMLEAMDHHLGRLITYLKERGDYQNTVFVVLSDNGPEAGNPGQSKAFARWAKSIGYNRDLETLGEKGSYAFIGPDFAAATAAPLAYYKFHGGEGGVRVPLIVSGPGVASSEPSAILEPANLDQADPDQAGRLIDRFSFITDLAPTILELAQIDNPPASDRSLVGRSLVPVLEDSNAQVHPSDEAVAFETAGHAGVFKGDHKLVRVGAPAGDGMWRLFDLALDPGETRNLAETMPGLLDELMADYDEYAERVGVLPVPSNYSPATQLFINGMYGRLRDNIGQIAIATAIALFLLTALMRRLRRRSRLRRQHA